MLLDMLASPGRTPTGADTGAEYLLPVTVSHWLSFVIRNYHNRRAQSTILMQLGKAPSMPSFI